MSDLLFLPLKGTVVLAGDVVIFTVRRVRAYSKQNTRKLEQFRRELLGLPVWLQWVVLNLTLSYSHGLAGRLLSRLQFDLTEYQNSQALSVLTQSNRYFLQDSLLSHPNYRLFLQLYRQNHNFIRPELNRVSFLTQLGGIRTFPGSQEAKETAIIRVTLERDLARLMALWSISSKNFGKLSRIPKNLLFDIIEFL